MIYRYVVDAVLESVTEITDKVDTILDSNGCPLKVKSQIDVAIDELLGNIVMYAYSGEKGKAIITVDTSVDNQIKIVFADAGIPFDPTAKEDPDITLEADERQIGGLGIFMVKKMMDSVVYERKDDKNVLTIVKSWEPQSDEK